MCEVRRREEEEEEKEPGIQNQKQEPHTKMWGKKNHEANIKWLGESSIFRLSNWSVSLVSKSLLRFILSSINGL